MPAPRLRDVNASRIAWAKRPWVNSLKIFSGTNIRKWESFNRLNISR